MRRERNHSNVTYGTKVLLKRAICQNTLLLSTILTNHSNVISVTTVFPKKSNLKKHIGKVHESKKPCTCNLLKQPKLFKKGKLLKTYFSNSLKRHILSVTDGRTQLFKCSICEANFSLKSNLKRHSFSS